MVFNDTRGSLTNPLTGPFDTNGQCIKSSVSDVCVELRNAAPENDFVVKDTAGTVLFTVSGSGAITIGGTPTFSGNVTFNGTVDMNGTLDMNDNPIIDVSYLLVGPSTQPTGLQNVIEGDAARLGISAEPGTTSIATTVEAIVQITGCDTDPTSNQGSLAVIGGQVDSGRAAILDIAGSRSTNAQLRAGTYTALQNGDNICQLNFLGDDGTDLRTRAATIDVEVNGSVATGSIDVDMTLRVFTDNSEIKFLHNDRTGSVNTAYSLKDTGHEFYEAIRVDVDNYSASATTLGQVLQLLSTTITDTSTAASGTRSIALGTRIDGPTFAATNSSVTINNAATLYINSPPSAGTNVTITNPWAFWVNSGNMRLNSDLFMFASNDYWQVTINTSSADRLEFRYNGDANEGGYIDGTGGTMDQMNFTGQHRNVLVSSDDTFNHVMNDVDATEYDSTTFSSPDKYGTKEGLIVVAVGACQNLDGTTNVRINEALPRVALACRDKDVRVYGVLSDRGDAEFEKEESGARVHRYRQGAFVSLKDKADSVPRVIVNSLGEGGIWVCDLNGAPQVGNLITTCAAYPGYGVVQTDDDLIHSYTVAKVTCYSGTRAEQQTRVLARGSDGSGDNPAIKLPRINGNSGRVLAYFVGCIYCL